MSHMPITLRSVPQRTELLSTDTDAATFFMNLESGQYLMLQATGRRIWNLIDGTAQVSDIIETLISEYEIDPETCQADTVEFLNDLQTHGAIDVVG